MYDDDRPSGELVRVKEAAQCLGVAPQTIHRYVAARLMKAVFLPQLGKGIREQVRIPWGEIKRVLQG